tara:strand:- start:163 stop:462 length:300 start_codon:yes stop_codon:yes gene_type:complete
MKDKFIGEDPNQEYSNEVQDQIQGDIEKGFEKISTLFPNPQMDQVIIFYFLMVWSRVMGRYGKNGEKHDNTFIKKMINKIMEGDMPPDINNTFAKEKNN